MAMFKWWDVLPDNERQRWTLDPFVSVGPLSFGMSPGEVSQALSDVTAEPQRHKRGWSAAETVFLVVASLVHVLVDACRPAVGALRWRPANTCD
ncbi:hypothetical protein OOK36_49625 [Streptomyces sp. NBC_00365]|uniref:hypothetical protein n=1 Tax=Streptomyces sp. NBC_00365 TaxID=2975726 RepID=UPI0022539061|nr:hypothetical protein [Streptomyces sp. NBC_00365]MCX5096643.1 hypothetical protein [Streptomyces sp. NBC_00365]